MLQAKPADEVEHCLLRHPGKVREVLAKVVVDLGRRQERPTAKVAKDIVRVRVKLVAETALEALARRELGLTHEKILPHCLAVKAYNQRNLGLVEAL